MRVAHVMGWFKVIGALLLVMCFALPMKSCTRDVDAEGKPVIVGADEVPAPGVRSITERYYLWDELNVDNPMSWLRVAVFLGPAAAMMFTWRSPKSRARTALWMIEPVLLAGVLFSLWWITYLYTADVGWYVACVGVASYFAGWLGETYQRGSQWNRRRQPEV